MERLCIQAQRLPLTTLAVSTHLKVLCDSPPHLSDPIVPPDLSHTRLHDLERQPAHEAEGAHTNPRGPHSLLYRGRHTNAYMTQRRCQQYIWLSAELDACVHDETSMFPFIPCSHPTPCNRTRTISLSSLIVRLFLPNRTHQSSSDPPPRVWWTRTSLRGCECPLDPCRSPPRPSTWPPAPEALRPLAPLLVPATHS